MLHHKVLFFATTLLAVALSHSAKAEYPERMIKFIIPWATALPDNKIVLDRMSEELGIPFQIEIAQGAGGVIAMKRVLDADPDGYVLGQCTGANMVLSFYRERPYDPSSATFVGPTTTLMPAVLVVKSSYEGSLADLLAQTRKDPRKISWGSGTRNTASIAGLDFVSRSGLRGTVLVPHKMATETLTQLMVENSGLDFAIELASFVLPNIAKGGRLRILAVLDEKRHRLLPDTPVPAEVGVGGGPYPRSFNGICGPKGLPPKVVERLQKALYAAMNDPAVQEKLKTISQDPWVVEPPNMAKVLKGAFAAETKKWDQIIREHNLPLQ